MEEEEEEAEIAMCLWVDQPGAGIPGLPEDNNVAAGRALTVLQEVAPRVSEGVSGMCTFHLLDGTVFWRITFTKLYRGRNW